MARALIAFLALFFRRVALPCHVCLTTQRIPASLDRRASVIRIEHSAQVRGDAELYWHARRHRFAVEARRAGGEGAMLLVPRLDPSILPPVADAWCVWNIRSWIIRSLADRTYGWLARLRTWDCHCCRASLSRRALL